MTTRGRTVMKSLGAQKSDRTRSFAAPIIGGQRDQQDGLDAPGADLKQWLAQGFVLG